MTEEEIQKNSEHWYEKYKKQQEINKELVDENEALKFAARMSEKTEKQLRAEIEEFKETNHELAELAIERQKEIDELEKCRQILSDCTDRQRKKIYELSDCNGRPQWHLTKNELPELQTATDTGDEYNTLVLCFWYDTDSRGKKTKVYDLDRWYPENDIWESGKKRDEVEAWMYLPEPPEEA